MCRAERQSKRIVLMRTLYIHKAIYGSMLLGKELNSEVYKDVNYQWNEASTNEIVYVASTSIILSQAYTHENAF